MKIMSVSFHGLEGLYFTIKASASTYVLFALI